MMLHEWQEVGVSRYVTPPIDLQGNLDTVTLLLNLIFNFIDAAESSFMYCVRVPS